MASKSMAYDNPAYQAVLPVALAANAAGASAIGGRFVAWAPMVIKSVSSSVITSGTSTTHVQRLLIFRNGGTSTETSVLFTLGSASLSTGVGNAAATSTMTLAQGDIVAGLQGTDATMVSAFSLEIVILPGANVTL
jgi:hypothetical protein